MKEVYIVTSGRYSDYHIEAVFSDLQQAERFIALRKKDAEYSFEECYLETWLIDHVSYDCPLYYYIRYIKYWAGSRTVELDSSVDPVFYSKETMDPSSRQAREMSRHNIVYTIPYRGAGASLTDQERSEDVLFKYAEDFVAQREAEEVGL